MATGPDESASRKPNPVLLLLLLGLALLLAVVRLYSRAKAAVLLMLSILGSSSGTRGLPAEPAGQQHAQMCSSTLPEHGQQQGNGSTASADKASAATHDAL
jgi:hypothetical protein